jgi:hypothetical protein
VVNKIDETKLLEILDTYHNNRMARNLHSADIAVLDIEILCEASFNAGKNEQYFVDRKNWVDNLAITLQDAKKAGIEDALRKYAWWKNGVQYVGSCGTTLEEALAEYGIKMKKG